MTDEQLAIIDQLTEAADRNLRSAAKVSMFANRLRETAIDEAFDQRFGADVRAQAAQERALWLRDAREELAQLLRDVEGPNPPQAPRRPYLD